MIKLLHCPCPTSARPRISRLKSPNSDQAERDAFAAFDSENLVRQKMVEALQKRFSEDKLKFAIGGQISIDVFPQVKVSRLLIG